MKLNFKKIASVLTSTVMLGSTIAFAAAANFPAPFVSGGAADVAVVYGANAPAGIDYATVLNINTKLNSAITTTTGTATVTGDSIKLERGSNKFNYADAMNTHYTTLDNDKLSTVLADGTYLNDDNTEYDYEQKVEMGAEALSFFHDSQFKDDVPTIGFNMDRNDHILNYTLDFTPDNAEGGATVTTGDEYPKIDNTEITILGKKFYISDAEFTSNGVQLTLLDTANSAIVSEGESKTVVVGDKSYDVSVDFVEDSDTCKLTINGETTNSINEGNTYKLSDGTYVGIKDVSYNSKDSGISKVEFSLGSGKIVLENGQEVKVNDDPVSETEDANGYTSVLKAFFTNTTATSVDKMVLQWNLNDDAWLAPGVEMTMPGLNAIKIAMTAWNTPDPETITIGDGGDYIQIVAPVKQGELKLPILYTNSSKTGFAGLGEEATHKLLTSSSGTPSYNLNETDNNYFVTTWISGDESESYAYEIGSITSNSGKNTTKLLNLVSGGSDLTFDTVGDTEDVGQITFTLVSADDSAGVVNISAAANSGTVYGSLLSTVGGLIIRLPVDTNITQTDGDINATAAAANPTTWTMNVTEQDKDQNRYSTAAPIKSFTVTIDGSDADGTQATGTSLTEVDESDDSDWEAAYVSSDIATKIRLYNPAGSSALKKVELIHPTEQSYADIYITESAASIGSGNSGGLAVSDSDVAKLTGKNLIVVGGSCVNTVAAKLLGSDAPLCGADWESKTGVGAGSFLIQTFASPYSAGKIATLVAGYNADDTTAAGKYLTTQTLDVSSSSYKVVKTAAEVQSLV